MTEKKLNVGVVGGLGLMASPMARHWKGASAVHAARVHDRGTQDARHDRCREAWKEHGAQLVSTFEALVGNGDLDGLFVCCGKNGDDIQLIPPLVQLLAKSAGAPKFICHMSTVSTGFALAAQAFSAKQGVAYVNYPLTGGVVGAEKGTLLILASGDPILFEKLRPALSLLGNPRHFGEKIAAGAEVKFIGHLMVFNGLMGICSAAAVHCEALNDSRLGGPAQSEFFDFLNTGAGGTRQWDMMLSQGFKQAIWNAPFAIRYAAVDAIYTAQLCLDLGVSGLVVQSVINTTLGFSYVLNEVGLDLSTQSIVREFVRGRARELDSFVLKHSGPREDLKASLEKCIQSFPSQVRESVLLNVETEMFEHYQRKR
jgi:3-hydroxyisobutyrate dehydrogenase-like beta-hydroxyacid dehydrogenase